MLRHQLASPGDRILLAVSGGVDSMVMTHLFLDAGYSIEVAHANFQLRGAEADGDQQFVENYCRQFGIRCSVKRFDTAQYATAQGLSIQMAARHLRYTWFAELLPAHKLTAVATAHHLNDALETVLLSIARGAGLEGWDGIAVKNNTVIRPLAFATRAQIETYARDHKLTWREDSSNAHDDYPRNMVRHRIVPLLKQLNPSLERSFEESMLKISGALELSHAGVRQWTDQYRQKTGDQIRIQKKGLASFEKPAAVLWNLIENFGFNLDQCQQIINALHGQPGKEFLSPHFVLSLDREWMMLSPRPSWLPEIAIERGHRQATMEKMLLELEENNDVHIIADPLIASIDADKLQFPLGWRGWKPGDTFYPLGMTGKKKVSDFLIDEKIARADKRTVSVLTSGNEIVWIVGHRLDDRFKITADTRRVLHVRLTGA